jgi:hypothetical protein
VLEMRFVAENLKGFYGAMSRLPAAQRETMAGIINRFLLTVMRDSKEKPPRVPVETGALQSSGFTEPAKIEGKKVQASIGYGGTGGVDYAVYVHDNLSGRIKNYKRPGSGPKFLSTHLDARQPELRGDLEKGLGDAWKGLF